jgi:TLP18.3/Psb32/MOLO-1 phosphatase superfamily protein
MPALKIYDESPPSSSIISATEQMTGRRLHLRVDTLRFKAAADVTLCVAVLVLAVLAGGCARDSAAPSQALLVSPTPNQNTSPTPSPTVESPLPPPKGFVNDFANVIDDKPEAVLEAKLKQLKERAQIEMAVATVETTGERDIFEYSLAVARGWGIGPPAGEEGGGLLLLLATKDRKWRIQVSRSLEADIPNEVAAEIGGRMTDALRKGRYGEAATRCVDGLIERLAERRGFPAKGGELNLQTSPAGKSKTSRTNKP